MHRVRSLLAALALSAAASMALADVPALAQQDPGRGDQRAAREEMQAGRALPIRDIERRVIPRMRESDEYIGFEYDARAQAYRLKFIRDGRMIWVDVDAQTARIIRVSR
ncbi:hypothetical protein [Aurantiacibacter gangjinensis]|uniref:Uncharacterized protein n=1 Tax=Aurantiacibacter gangjinensis TaxID=502682 RepID=A0A0G9MV48_9SPHN|nr:hypothetical protein [Aurantiacibacter gangjinensis]APE29056.1 hypothetical protein BMF35_a2227 [Aurantiacibacter gangjinensis]KLE33148.1 hypothetical protein AAW01_03995 [Aurantiacibacter gangjinensis]